MVWALKTRIYFGGDVSDLHVYDITYVDVFLFRRAQLLCVPLFPGCFDVLSNSFVYLLEISCSNSYVVAEVVNWLSLLNDNWVRKALLLAKDYKISGFAYAGMKVMNLEKLQLEAYIRARKMKYFRPLHLDD